MEVILGTMTFGQQVTKTDIRSMLDLFLDFGHRKIDTAYIYGDGRTEELLGEVLRPGQRQQVRIASKVHPGKGGGLSPKGLTEQLETSLKRLGTDYVDLLYLHQPDHDTPLEATLKACQELRQQGKFQDLGLSNYASWQVADIHHRCLQIGCPPPGMYQGMYNAITREVEYELFPALNHFQVAFSCYNPLAGGLLTGKHEDPSSIPDSGRFQLFEFYRERYWKQSSFKALESVRFACRESGIPMAEAALRFLKHHSALSAAKGDGIILGASSVEHLEKNLRSLQAGPLPESILQAYEQAWALTRPHCPGYFR